MAVRTPLRTALLALALVGAAAAAQAQIGRVQGLVRDETGHPIKGASVVAQNPDATPSSFTASTDARGRWTMMGLRAGTWRFRASAAGYQTATGTGRIETIGTNPSLEFTLVKAGIEAAGVTASSEVDTLDADLAAADALMSAGSYGEAATAYRAILARAPARTGLKVRIGQALRLDRDFDRALETLGEIPPDDPAASEAAREIGLTYFDRGDLERADEVLTAMATRPTASREDVYAVGEVKWARNQPAAAAEWYLKAAAADPKWARPLLKLGLVAVNRGDKVQAAKYLEQAIAVEPDSPEATQARTILDHLK